MPQSNQTRFRRLGNLAFYDEWSPDYIYFKSLYKASEYYNLNNGPNAWDPVEAGAIAQRAINEALAHKYLKNNSKEESYNYFEKRFFGKNGIVPFLEKAYIYECNNETFWLKAKISELKELFKDRLDERKDVAKLIDIMSNTKERDYNAMITMINIILQGKQNTKTIAEYESKRIKEITDTLVHLVRSRQHQTAGVLRNEPDQDKVIASIMRASKKLWDKIDTTYFKYGSKLSSYKEVSGTDKWGNKITKKKYALFGGRSLSKIQGTVSQVIANWAQATVEDVIKKPETLEAIIKQISPATWRSNPNLGELEGWIKEVLALGIIKYGMDNLQSLLNKEISEVAIQAIEEDLKSNPEFFDTVNSIRIGLTNIDEEALGYKIAEPKLFKAAEEYLDLVKAEHGGEELYKYVDMAIQSMTKSKLDNSYLVQVLDNGKYTTGRRWEETKQLIDLIHSVEHIREELDKLKEQYKKKKKNIMKQIHLPQNKEAYITISVVNGQPRVEQSELIEAIKGTNVYKEILQMKSFSPHDLSRTIAILKRNASIQLHKDIIESIKADVNKINPNELVKKLRGEINKVSIRFQGWKTEEIISSIQLRQSSNGLVAHIGDKNTKNDVLTIEFRYEGLVQSVKARINESQNSFINEKKLVRAYENAQSNFYQQLYEGITKEAKRVNLSDSTDPRYSAIVNKIVKQDLAHDNAWSRLTSATEKFINVLEKHVPAKDRKSQEKREEIFFQDFLQNSIVISTTVKNYNTYHNQIGFLGGSLGGNLDAQLTNVADIFKNAGSPIPKEELDWIKFSVLNCFEGSVLGTENKYLIENYLGALMAFALFDEGGAESAIISKFYETYFKSLSRIDQPRILHLYRVNGIYVPGSLVIKRTLETIKNQILPAIHTQIPKTMKRGAGLTIINNTKESYLPNRPISRAYIEDGKDKSIQTDAWSYFGNQQKTHVRLQIVFLAGLLDIINGINKTMSQLDIPK